MDAVDEYFERIGEKMMAQYPDVTMGQLMAKPGLKVNDKVFCSFFKNELYLKVGVEQEILTRAKLKGSKPLAPFKTKPPIKGWVVLPMDLEEHFDELVVKAYEFVKAA